VTTRNRIKSLLITWADPPAHTVSTMTPVVLLPSLGRPPSDFDDLIQHLRAAGYVGSAVDLDPHAKNGLTFEQMADSVVASLQAGGIDCCCLVGHAFGNRLARMITARHPGWVSSLVLLACGGSVEMAPDVAQAFLRCFADDVSPSDHLAAVGHAFFADPATATVWSEGWSGDLARRQRAALTATPLQAWWDAIAPRTLVVQGLNDVIAVPENGRMYAAAHPEVTLVELANAGHALLPEQPAAIASLISSFLSND
jgi:pimeloyl-ACP methyl ester carboxylesterase